LSPGDRALAINPKYLLSLIEKGDFLDSIGNYRLAISYYDKALAIDPNNAEALNGKQQAVADLNQQK
jgi:tetratricopeptide (TPR) repeat protein